MQQVQAGTVTEPTISQLKAQSPESLWHFLLQVPQSWEAQLLYAMLLAGLLGMVTSFLLKWSQNQIAANPVRYFFCDNPRGTVFAVLWLISAAVGSVALGGYTAEGGVFVGWGKVLFDGWLLGTGGDLGLNKSTRPEWSEEVRKEKLNQEGKP